MSDKSRSIALIITFACFIFSIENLNAQIFYNNGANVFVNTTAIVQVNGAFSNNGTPGYLTNNGEITITSSITNNATVDGNGIYKVGGDWINNSNFVSETSDVILNGNAQQITGTAETHFNDLSLAGTGTKTQTINTYVSGVLDIDDHELSTSDYTMFVENTITTAITRTSGFVSSLNTGSLSRKTLNNVVYVFPVGSSIGATRYRPVEITPSSNAPNTFTVRMANFDASTEGFDRTSKDTSLCNLNPYFFHRIKRTFGIDAANIAINYNSTLDGSYTEIANWKSASTIWQNIAPVLNNGGYITKQAWSDFTDFPYILGLKKIIVHIDPVIPVCSNVNPFNLSATVLGGIWSGSGITSPGNGTFNASVAGPGEHDIVYSLGGQCGGSDTIQLLVNEAADLASTTSDETCTGANDGSLSITLSGGSPPYLIHWSNGSTSTNLTSLEPGEYSVTINDTKNCIIAETYDVLVGPKECGTPVIYIPNAFSPNDDGKNDVLLVRGKGIISLNLTIFDRWGNKVFDTNNQSIGWDGTYKNLPMAPAIFAYTLEAVMSSGEKVIKSGNISLIR
jgi:gliding motility-associated-like protein